MLKYAPLTSRLFITAAAAAVAISMITATSISSVAHAGEQLASGTFFGQSNHVTTGKITIEKEGDQTIVILHDDFSLDGAPSPTLGFSKAGKFDTKTEFAKLESLSGEQRYAVPAGILVKAYDAFTVWCSEVGVPLGSAKLG